MQRKTRESSPTDLGFVHKNLILDGSSFSWLSGWAGTLPPWPSECTVSSASLPYSCSPASISELEAQFGRSFKHGKSIFSLSHAKICGRPDVAYGPPLIYPTLHFSIKKPKAQGEEWLPWGYIVKLMKDLGLWPGLQAPRVWLHPLPGTNPNQRPHRTWKGLTQCLL